MLKKALWPALAATALLVAVVYGCRYVDWEERRTPEELARVALAGNSPDERQLAAAELTEYGEDAKQQMREVLARSDDPNVRGTCIQGLGKIYDYESIDVMLAGLEDDSLVVQGSSLVALRKMLGRSFHFEPRMPEPEKQRRIHMIRAEWEKLRTSGMIEQFKARMQRKEAEKNS